MSAIMLDLETLSVRADAVILTIGAVKFDPYSISDMQDAFYCRINVDDQLALERHVDDGTIAWWSKQHETVREEALGDGNRVSLDEFTSQLNTFLVGAKSIWAHGAVFDIGILENIYEQIGKAPLWDYWQIRDSRTLFAVHGDPRVKVEGQLHNALEDAISQARGVQQIYEKCNIKKVT